MMKKTASFSRFFIGLAPITLLARFPPNLL